MSSTPEHPQDTPHGSYPPPPRGDLPAASAPPSPPPPGPANGTPPVEAQGRPWGEFGHGRPSAGYGTQSAPGYGPGGAPGGYPPTAYEPGAPLSPSDQRLWSVLAHVLTLLVGFLAPLVIWLVLRGRGAFSEHHAKESLNFQITMTLAAIALSFLSVVTFGIGLLLFFPFGILVLVLVILAAVKASQGEPYRYPLTLRLVS